MWCTHSPTSQSNAYFWKCKYFCKAVKGEELLPTNFLLAGVMKELHLQMLGSKNTACPTAAHTCTSSSCVVYPSRKRQAALYAISQYKLDFIWTIFQIKIFL